MPIKQVNGTVIYIRDMTQVSNDFVVQTNIVRENERRSSLLSILKSGSASTLDVVNRVKQVLPQIKATAPKELNLSFLFDQSIFVKASVKGAIKEGLIAACLTATMILIFLGWELAQHPDCGCLYSSFYPGLHHGDEFSRSDAQHHDFG